MAINRAYCGIIDSGKSIFPATSNLRLFLIGYTNSSSTGNMGAVWNDLVISLRDAISPVIIAYVTQKLVLIIIHEDINK
jgi:hypothetical protein